MAYANKALEGKITDMYPELRTHNIGVSLGFDESNDSYIVNLKKDSHQLVTYIDRSDADECMEGMKCVHLGVKIGEFVKNFESEE